MSLGFRTGEREEVEDFLQSRLISADIMENYKTAAAKLRRELAAMDFADHTWNLKSYDQHGVAIVKSCVIL